DPAPMSSDSDRPANDGSTAATDIKSIRSATRAATALPMGPRPTCTTATGLAVVIPPRSRVRSPAGALHLGNGDPARGHRNRPSGPTRPRRALERALEVDGQCCDHRSNGLGT